METDGLVDILEGLEDLEAEDDTLRWLARNDSKKTRLESLRVRLRQFWIDIEEDTRQGMEKLAWTLENISAKEYRWRISKIDYIKASEIVA